MFVVRRK